MTEKTSCQFCGTHLEFDVENANQFIECPSCGKQTRLLLPPVSKPVSQTIPKAEVRLGFFKPMRTCGDCGFEISKRAVFCPKCGGFNTVPFSLVWRVVCLVMLCFTLLGLLGLIINEVVKALGS